MTEQEKPTGMGIPVTTEERALVTKLCDLEGRNRKSLFMWLVRRRLAELEEK